jgi:hypothetical protein
MEVKVTKQDNGSRPGLLQRSLIWAVGYLALAVSAVLAMRFACTSADTLVDASIRAVAAGVAAVVGCHGPAWIWRSLRMREWGAAFLATLGFAVCLAVSLAGGIGTIAAGSDKSQATRARESASYSDLRNELETLRSARSSLPAHRPVGTIESDMTAARVDRRWTTSSLCADATATASRTFCADYARLDGELAAAKTAAELDEKVHELTERLETVPAVRAVNPQAEVIARLFHLTPADAEAWYALLFALAVEAAAMSVLLTAETTTHHRYILAQDRTVQQTVLPSPAAHRTRQEGATPVGRVTEWMAKRAVPADSMTATTLDVLHGDYDVWCRGEGLEAISVDAFADEFDRLREVPELAGNIDKVGNRYYGIKLRGSKVARLPVPRRDAG